MLGSPRSRPGYVSIPPDGPFVLWKPNLRWAGWPPEFSLASARPGGVPEVIRLPSSACHDGWHPVHLLGGFVSQKTVLAASRAHRRPGGPALLGGGHPAARIDPGQHRLGGFVSQKTGT